MAKAPYSIQKPIVTLASGNKTIDMAKAPDTITKAVFTLASGKKTNDMAKAPSSIIAGLIEASSSMASGKITTIVLAPHTCKA